MRMGKDIGLALGMLAGTTMASGIAFLMGLEPVSLICTVSMGGAVGATAGIAAAVLMERE
ncbi:hypothetical protein P4H66_04605 [Paenibacillus dokdonensis]|uniref:Glycine zipper family protein n=1 Tax=Paenibacillus dokdonensis TaxID=2567944 RepID=A0ABU6GHE6_9BACL|nr:hypothetical protein [Paenibacillus dokdonensis]MEC0239151.1 hypothetical protein [Paenibacillus dokdonensis]